MEFYASIFAMTRIPKLYETAAEAREPDVSDNLAPMQADRAENLQKRQERRRRLAIAGAAILLTPILVKAGIESYDYGYHPQNQPAHQAEAGH